MTTAERVSSARSTLSPLPLDGALLALILLAYLLLIPQAPHADAVVWARSLQASQIVVKPNYLLMQPIALSLYSIWRSAGLPQDPQLFQKHLDVFLGVCSLAIFTVCLRQLRVPVPIRAATVAFMAFSYNFFYLSTSDHIKLATSPFLMLTLLFLLRYSAAPGYGLNALAAGALALAICTLMNSVIWFLLLIPVIYFLSGGPTANRLKHAAVFSLTASGISLLVFLAFYFTLPQPSNFLTWLTSYGGNRAGVGFGGITPITLGRTFFAVLNNFAYSSDIGPLVKALLLGHAVSFYRGAATILNMLAFAAALSMLLSGLAWLGLRRAILDPVDTRALTVAASAVSAFLLFGFFWNSSEEEFWFQLTGPSILAAALCLKYTPPLRAYFAPAAALILINNLLTFAIPRSAYPYNHYVQELAATVRPDDLIVHDGSEPINTLLYGVSLRAKRQTFGVLSSLAKNGFRVMPTVLVLDGEIEQARWRGGRVYVFDVFAASRLEYPWTHLEERFRIGPEPFVRALHRAGTYRKTVVAGRDAWILDR